ncbi:MAG: nitronate monooxygenase [bacterium]|nr:nitronate monooxygenase [bacterium]
MRTAFTEEYELDIPVASAGMAFVARAELVAAVSAAGGIGVLGGSAMPPALLEQEIAAVRAATDRRFGVNFIARFCQPEHIALCANLRVPVVSFFWDNPERAWVEELHAAGARVWMQVGSVDEAAGAVEMGADLVIAQGIEAGGHNRSTAATFCLVPAVVDMIAPVPVLAAGGIADGRGVVAAVALGADGAWIGTRFLASAEADAHRDYKARLVGAGPRGGGRGPPPLPPPGGGAPPSHPPGAARRRGRPRYGPAQGVRLGLPGRAGPGTSQPDRCRARRRRSAPAL